MKELMSEPVTEREARQWLDGARWAEWIPDEGKLAEQRPGEGKTEESRRERRAIDRATDLESRRSHPAGRRG
jgi:hypothetical protein